MNKYSVLPISLSSSLPLVLSVGIQSCRIATISYAFLSCRCCLSSHPCYVQRSTSTHSPQPTAHTSPAHCQNCPATCPLPSDAARPHLPLSFLWALPWGPILSQSTANGSRWQHSYGLVRCPPRPSLPTTSTTSFWTPFYLYLCIIAAAPKRTQTGTCLTCIQVLSNYPVTMATLLLRRCCSQCSRDQPSRVLAKRSFGRRSIVSRPLDDVRCNQLQTESFDGPCRVLFIGTNYSFLLRMAGWNPSFLDNGILRLCKCLVPQRV